MIIGAVTCRAARGLLNWPQAQLAEMARVGLGTVKNFEAGRSLPSAENLLAMQHALEAAEVEFLPEGAVRLNPDKIEIGPDYVVDRYKFRMVASRRDREIIVDVPSETVDDAAESTGASTAERRASFKALRRDFDACAKDLIRSQAPEVDRVVIESTIFDEWKKRRPNKLLRSD
jgi:transcriptional regulator with XRE-family HTH domain